MDNHELLIFGTRASQNPIKTQEAQSDLSAYVPEKVRRRGEIPFALLWIIFGMLGFYFALDMTSDSYSAPSVFPKLISTLIIICGVVILVNALKREKPDPSSPGVLRYLLPIDVFVMITLIILYCFALPRLHFFPSSLAFLSAGMIYLYRGKKSFIQSLSQRRHLAFLS